MRARLPTFAVRLVVLIAVWLLGTATLTLAQDAEAPAPPVLAVPDPAASETLETGPLVVPDVRGLPYVFAKGVLEDAGFAWKVKGKVEGYAVNLVEEQGVKPGTRVVDTGAPVIELKLEVNPDYEERGVPQAASPYKGTELVLANGGEPETAGAPPQGDGEPSEDAPAETQEGPAETDPTAPETETDPTGEAPEASDGEKGETETIEVEQTSSKDTAASEPEADGAKKTQKRPPAFVVPGAPREPLGEIPLPRRAEKLERRIASAAGPSAELLDHFRYQHAWIVKGAGFGWWHGAEALRILIRVDEDVQRRFGWSAASEQEARAALAEVLRLSKR